MQEGAPGPGVRRGDTQAEIRVAAGRTMRAVVYEGPRQMALRDLPYPLRRDGEVILKVEAIGICGSELHGYLGHDKLVRPGAVFGHEFAGIVAEVNSTDVERFPLDTRVTSNSAVTCGRCDFCKQGRDNLCLSRTRIGKVLQGGFAEYVAVPVSALIEIPPDMDAIHASLVEPLATPMHGITLAMRSLARPLAEAKALVLGGGTIGLLAAMLLRSFGCSDVTLAEINPARRAAAERHAGCRTYDPRASAPDEEAYDYVFDAVGGATTMAAAVRAVRRGGVVTEVGLQDREVALDIQKLTRAGITLIGGANYPTTDLRASVRAIHAGLLGELSWVETRSLEQAPQAFAELAAGNHPFAKIILLPSNERGHTP